MGDALRSHRLAEGRGPASRLWGQRWPIFQQWLTRWLLPTLDPGTTIILDNLWSIATPTCGRPLRRRTATPAISRRLALTSTPFEQISARIKTDLRGVGARSPDTLIAAIGDGLTQVTAQEIAICYRARSYEVLKDSGQHVCGAL